MWWVAQPAICMAQPAIWWANPLQTLSQGLVLTLRFTFDPELDNTVFYGICYFPAVSSFTFISLCNCEMSQARWARRCTYAPVDGSRWSTTRGRLCWPPSRPGPTSGRSASSTWAPQATGGRPVSGRWATATSSS